MPNRSTWGDGSRDSYRFTAAGVGHRTSLEDLLPTEHATAVAAIQRWAGVTQQRARHVPALDDVHPDLRIHPLLPSE